MSKELQRIQFSWKWKLPGSHQIGDQTDNLIGVFGSQVICGQSMVRWEHLAIATWLRKNYSSNLHLFYLFFFFLTLAYLNDDGGVLKVKVGTWSSETTPVDSPVEYSL